MHPTNEENKMTSGPMDFLDFIADHPRVIGMVRSSGLVVLPTVTDAPSRDLSIISIANFVRHRSGCIRALCV